jgi:hypothetical protein
MFKDFKHRVVAIVLAYLAIHFIATVCYVAPESAVPNRLRGYATWYMMPVFHQQWDLFAPTPPKTSHEIHYRFRNKKGEWSKWIDPGKEIREAHHLFRIGYPGKLYITYFNLLYYLANEVHTYRKEKHPAVLDDNFAKTYSYKAIIHYLKRYTAKTYGIKPQWICLSLKETRFTAPGEKPIVTKTVLPWYSTAPYIYVKDIPDFCE